MATLVLHSVHEGVVTLGPGPALAVWVQGCPIGCTGCGSPRTWDPSMGVLADTDDVAAWMNRSALSHLTISGGEPMEQAPALVELVDKARRGRDWVVTCYSGYGIERLRAGGLPGTTGLLERLDVLIDGPYVAARHAPLRWRASDNQRIHPLSGRVEVPVEDTSAGVMPVISPDGSLELIGVLPEQGMLDRITGRMAEAGRPMTESDEPRSFPFSVRPQVR